jgi:acetoin utilization deacetylase AcuC-like enzyme
MLRQHPFDQDPHNQLVQMHQQELEELKLKQMQFHNANKSSFFSDPHLLKSLRIANSTSNAHLDMATKMFSPDFGASNANEVKNRIIFNKNNQADVSKISMMMPLTLPKTDADLLIKKANLVNNEPTMEMDTDYPTDNKVYRYTTGIVYDKLMLKHECTCGNQANHLETPNRIKSIWNRFKANHIHDECEIVKSKLATISDLLTCHNEQYSLIFGSDLESRPRLPPEYLQNYMMNVTLASCQGFALTYDQDNSWNEEFTPIACRVAVGSTYELASLVSAGKLKNGFALVRPPGSHAEYNKPLGFCYFNTVAIVAKMLKRNLSMDRILIVDWDVHHGNGTQQMTYTDSNIMYISLHRHDNATFFPGTGSIYECGQDNGLGKNVNIAWNGKLNPPMSDAEYLAAFRCVVMPIAQAFKPQIVLVSCGFDGTENHPKELGGYKLSPMCFAYMTKKLMSLAEGKVVLALEGGYDINSLCDCSEMCINALMDKQIPSFPNETLDALPNNSAILDLENVIEVQSKLFF